MTETAERREVGSDLLTYAEAAQELGTTAGALKQAIHRGLLHPVKLPRQRRKFLRREELLWFRRAKDAPARAGAWAAVGDRSGAGMAGAAGTPAIGPEALEVLRLFALVAGTAWTTNAQAISANAASIRDTFLETVRIVTGGQAGVPRADSPGARGVARPGPRQPTTDGPTRFDPEPLMRELRYYVSQTNGSSAEQETLRRVEELVARMATWDPTGGVPGQS